MKKIVISFIAVCGFVVNGFAGCNSAITLMYKGTQKPEHNEFLYENEYQWQASNQGYENTRHQTSGNGKGFECDSHKSASCTGGEIITMNAGHYFKGEKINQNRKYQCVTWGMDASFDDGWVVVDDGMCNTRQFGDIPIGGKYKGLLTKAQCSGYRVSDDTHGVKFELKCQEGRNLICMAVECDNSNMKPNEVGICVENRSNPDPKPEPSSLEKCLAEKARQGNAEALACCYLPKTGANGAQWNGKNCKCNDTSKHFEIVQGRGQCVADSNPTPTPTPTPTPAPTPTPKICPQYQYSPDNKTCVCIDNINARLVGGQCTCSHLGDAYMAGDSYCKCSSEHQEINNGKCQDTDEYRISQIKTKIDVVFGRLNTTMGGFEKSVWKNTEGGFNTARLASDSIAGVVLGTAGGLITSKIVKKNQLKKGFEDINCSIGGQTVANYGDTMRVGLQ